jgi:hypothetical protein
MAILTHGNTLPDGDKKECAMNRKNQPVALAFVQ